MNGGMRGERGSIKAAVIMLSGYHGNFGKRNE